MIRYALQACGLFRNVVDRSNSFTYSFRRQRSLFGSRRFDFDLDFRARPRRASPREPSSRDGDAAPPVLPSRFCSPSSSFCSTNPPSPSPLCVLPLERALHFDESDFTLACRRRASEGGCTLKLGQDEDESHGETASRADHTRSGPNRSRSLVRSRGSSTVRSVRSFPFSLPCLESTNSQVSTANRRTHSFHSTLNSYLILFDRHLHTPSHVRETSTVLFTSLLAVSAKFFRPDLYPTLLAHAKALTGRAMAEGTATVAVVQSLFLLVFWKEPFDQNAWLKVGYAIRLAYQLHLHRERKTPFPNEEAEARLIMDRERTWMCATVFDHLYILRLDEEEDDGFCQTSMIPSYRINPVEWLADTRRWNVDDDLEIGPTLEWVKVLRLAKDIAHSRPSHARSLSNHLQGILESAYDRWVTTPSEPGFARIVVELELTHSNCSLSPRVQSCRTTAFDPHSVLHVRSLRCSTPSDARGDGVDGRRTATVPRQWRQRSQHCPFHRVQPVPR